MAEVASQDRSENRGKLDRRRFFSTSSVAMTGGLMASYGTFFVMAGRYVYPTEGEPSAWMFVTELGAMNPGDSIEYRGPTGAKIVIARQGDTGTVADFIALSSTCPHLGCQVEWQPHNERFFCPCHNGVFDPQGKATEGPPAAAGQSLPRYQLMVERGLLFIEVPTESVVDPWKRRLDTMAKHNGEPTLQLATNRAPSPSGAKEA